MNAEPPPLTDTKRGQGIAIAGVTLLALSLVDGIRTAIQVLVPAFDTLGTTKGADPSALAQEISVALMTWLGAAVVSAPIPLIGAICLGTALLYFRYRQPWFFRTTVMLSWLAIFTLFPLGGLLGITLLVMFIRKRKEFSKTA